MDNKLGRRLKHEDYRQHHHVNSYKYPVLKFLKERGQILLTSILLLILLGLLFAITSRLPAPATGTPPNGVTAVDYSVFVEQVRAGNVLSVTIQGNEMSGELKHTLHGQPCLLTQTTPVNNPLSALSPPAPTDPACTIYTRLPAKDNSTFMPLLFSHNIVVTTQPAKQLPAWLNVLWGVLAVILVLFLMKLPPGKGTFSLDAMDKKVNKVLKSRVRRFERTQEKSNTQSKPGTPSLAGHTTAEPVKHPKSMVTFADVAGIDEVRADLEEVVQFLRSPQKFNRLGAHIPRGILLVGPPGTGKTLLAKAVAGEANVPFLHMSASEFVEMYVGVGASRVRTLFQQARESAPCVVFIDEIDAVGRKRLLRLGDPGERDQTLNQLLVELDGFDGRSTVIVLAATNRVDMLDQALLRPGRFDRLVTVSLPDRAGREAVLRVHTRHTPLHAAVQLDQLARQTTGMSGADLTNLVNEAALCAARHGLDSITTACFEEALERIQLGALRPLVMSEVDRRIIAFHESGHALVAYYLPEADPVSHITILPRGQHLGVTQFTAQEDRYNYSRETLIARIAVGLGGRVAEELTFGPEGVTTGAENDLQSVTALAWRMVTHWGMGSQVGVVFADYCAAASSGLNYQADAMPMQSCSTESESAHQPQQIIGKLAEPQPAAPPISPAARYVSSAEMATLIDSEVQSILHEGRAIACSLLTEHHVQLTKLAQALMEQEQLDRAQFEAVLQE